MSKQALQRLIKLDMKDSDRFHLREMGIYLEFDEANLMRAKAMILGPEGTPYEKGMLFFTIAFPKNYPFSPPLVQYVSASRVRIHPNLYVGHSSEAFQGKVCLSSLNTWTGPKWTSVMTIGTILLTIQSLLDAHPLRNEPGYESVTGAVEQTYNRVVEYDTLRQLVIRHGDHLRSDTEANEVYEGFGVFNEAIRDHLTTHRTWFLEKVTRLCQEYPKEMQYLVGIYRLRVKISYPEMNKAMGTFLNLIEVI